MENITTTNDSTSMPSITEKKSIFKKINLFRTKTNKQLGKKEVSAAKKKKQIITIVITSLVLVVCIVVVGVLIWLAQSKGSSNSIIEISNYTFDSVCNNICKFFN